jgi:hypothetical protein
MRTLLFLIAGLLMLAAFFLLAKLFAPNYPSARTWTTVIFISLWLIATLLNLLGGIKVGYSFTEELPIFLLVFGLPVLASIVLRLKLL